MVTFNRQTPSEKILRHLRDLVERQSTSTDVSRQLDHTGNWLYRVFKRELAFDLDRAEEILHVLKLPLRSFLDWCFEDDPLCQPGQALCWLQPRLAQAPDRFLEDLRSRLSLVLDELEPKTVQDEGSDMPRVVASIDQLRFTDRMLAKGKIEAYLEERLQTRDSSSPLLAQEMACSLSVWAAIQRTRDRQGDAASALSLALSIGNRFRLDATMALLLQRSSYLLRDWGEPRQAIQFVERAIMQFACLGRIHNIGRCLVDRGSLYLHLSDHPKVISSCTGALKMLPEEGWRSRSAAYQNIAEAQLRSGALVPALEAVDMALDLLVVEDHDVCFGHTCWIKARILLKRGEFAEAIAQLRRSLDHLITGGGMPVDIALVALDLACTHLAMDDFGEMRKLALRIQAISPIIRTSPIVDRVLMEFVCVARYRKVTKVFLAESRRELESAVHPGRRLQLVENAYP